MTIYQDFTAALNFYDTNKDKTSILIERKRLFQGKTYKVLTSDSSKLTKLITWIYQNIIRFISFGKSYDRKLTAVEINLLRPSVLVASKEAAPAPTPPSTGASIGEASEVEAAGVDLSRLERRERLLGNLNADRVRRPRSGSHSTKLEEPIEREDYQDPTWDGVEYDLERILEKNPQLRDVDSEIVSDEGFFFENTFCGKKIEDILNGICDKVFGVGEESVRVIEKKDKRLFVTVIGLSALHILSENFGSNSTEVNVEIASPETNSTEVNETGVSSGICLGLQKIYTNLTDVVRTAYTSSTDYSDPMAQSVLEAMKKNNCEMPEGLISANNQDDESYYMTPYLLTAAGVTVAALGVKWLYDSKENREKAVNAAATAGHAAVNAGSFALDMGAKAYNVASPVAIRAARGAFDVAGAGVNLAVAAIKPKKTKNLNRELRMLNK